MYNVWSYLDNNMHFHTNFMKSAVSGQEPQIYQVTVNSAQHIPYSGLYSATDRSLRTISKKKFMIVYYAHVTS